ncbi:hypothetical protein KIH39_20255 [Telmatocola sphagniphila]|uniref:Uncharacterized protein n=1 Tax=Telmatocola sphagniphila TaxID=1123043 RepID=A0A8E6B611_9BACT|nr:hypothetical protein [Telmatocola sphagniphila]QVL31158.1 hypothetical protein KIH39_20255 [Telmatocola sphagniphila]
MSSPILNLLPDFNLKARNPLSILDEFAQAIAEKTEGKIQAKIYVNEEAGRVSVDFDITANHPDHPRIRLFSLSYDIDCFYPIRFDSTEYQDEFGVVYVKKCKSEASFTEAIIEIINDEDTLSKLESLIASTDFSSSRLSSAVVFETKNKQVTGNSSN